MWGLKRKVCEVISILKGVSISQPWKQRGKPSGQAGRMEEGMVNKPGSVVGGLGISSFLSVRDGGKDRGIDCFAASTA